MRYRFIRLRLPLLLSLVLGVALLLCATWPSFAQDYSGQETCLACHSELSKDYAHTVHSKALSAENALNPLMARGCESCHGPGRTHASSGGQNQSGEGWLTFREEGRDAEKRKAEACLQCHQGDTQRYWQGSAHESRGLSCSSCHKVMKPVSDRKLLSRPTEAAVCGECHHIAGAQSKRASHMPTRTGGSGIGGEGSMTCGSCHNSHGTVADKLVDAHTINDNCTSCHAEKRGPFLWEHSPVSESCLNCHVAHGSLKPNLLRLSAPRICQTCHVQVTHVSEARVPESRFAVGQSCMQCHPKVHGSNHPSGSFFTR